VPVIGYKENKDDDDDDDICPYGVSWLPLDRFS
jgi:hypothetical protein